MTPARRRRPYRYASALLIAGVLACWRPVEPGPAYRDLLLDQALRSNLEPPGALAELACGDETHFARALRPDEVLTTMITIGEAARLVMTGCLEPSAQRAQGGSVTATLELGGERRELVLPLDPPQRWQSRTLDLAAHAGKTARLRVKGRRESSEARLFLRDLYFEQQQRLPARPVPPPGQVLLISVDTLRHDAIAALGGPWPTPALDQLVAASETFVYSYATASWTKPSHGSLLTGHHPRVHNAFTRENALHPALPTLAERFQRGGFATAALVQDIIHLDARFGFDRGFDRYQTVDWTWPQMARAAVNWFGEHRAEPFFYFLHTFAAHSDFHRLPYEADGVSQTDVEARFGVPGYGCLDLQCASGRLALINTGAIEPIPGEEAILRYLYGQGVRELDAGLGRLLDDLRALGIFDDLLIVLTSDHGEMFLEHGKVLHGNPYEPVLRVPLIVKWPGGERAGTRSELPVSGVDVAPTLLAAQGLPTEGLPGDDLRVLRRRDRPIFAGGYDQIVMVDRLKLATFAKDGKSYLYDLASDPDEEHNLVAERPDELERLNGYLRQQLLEETRLRRDLDRVRDAGELAQPLSDEERERLRALGYLDG